MAKKKAVKKAKTTAKPAKASAKKKATVAKKTSVGSKAKVKAKAAPAKKAAAKKSSSAKAGSASKSKAAVKPAKKAAAKTVKEKAAPAKPKVKKDEGYILAESVVNGMLEKKGQNVRWLDLRGIENSVCDYFIICEGNSNTQVEAIAESVEDVVKKETGQRPYRSEGWENALWILIDYINVVVHVFERETRHFYNLESLWADAEEIKVEQ